jgi:hypothetical protein
VGVGGLPGREELGDEAAGGQEVAIAEKVTLRVASRVAAEALAEEP